MTRLQMPLWCCAIVLAAATARAQTPAAVVDMTDGLRFEPGAVEVEVGETVEWRNVSSMAHTVTADAALAADPSAVALPDGAEPFDSGVISPGQTYQRAFSVPGRYDYLCLPHEGLGMRGSVTVVDSASSGDDPGLADPIPEPIEPSGITLELTPVMTDLVAPSWATSAPGQPTQLFVVDQPGQIHAVDVSTGQSRVFLDVAERLVPLGISGPDSFDERGLLGLAFHPDYQTNGLLYTYTSEPAEATADFSTLPDGVEANHQSVVIEWHVPTPGEPDATPDPASAREVLRIDQPQFNHNAGTLLFDQDGLLLVALGDGGAADDQGDGHAQEGNGQTLSNPLGAILRIDPLGRDSANEQYGIPTTNPFFGQPDIVEEILAYGFRNPFRMSIDPVSAMIWLGDAGQHDIEEVDVVVPGGNHGWRLKEGSFPFDPNGDEQGFVVAPGDGDLPPDLVDPVAEYDHDEGVAVVGGFVYRGLSHEALTARYVFGDHGTADAGGRLFVLEPAVDAEPGDDEAADGVGPVSVGPFEIRELAVEGGFAARLLGFGVDADGELYVLANETGTPFGQTGVVLRVDAATTGDADVDPSGDDPGGAGDEAGDGPPATPPDDATPDDDTADVAPPDGADPGDDTGPPIGPIGPY